MILPILRSSSGKNPNDHPLLYISQFMWLKQSQTIPPSSVFSRWYKLTIPSHGCCLHGIVWSTWKLPWNPKKTHIFRWKFLWDDPRQRSHFAVTRLSSAVNWPLTELTRATEARREGTSAGNPMGNPWENGGFPWEIHPTSSQKWRFSMGKSSRNDPRKWRVFHGKIYLEIWLIFYFEK